jgi:hypothetical protein
MSVGTPDLQFGFAKRDKNLEDRRPDGRFREPRNVFVASSRGGGFLSWFGGCLECASGRRTSKGRYAKKTGSRGCLF